MAHQEFCASGVRGAPAVSPIGCLAILAVALDGQARTGLTIFQFYTQYYDFVISRSKRDR